MLDNAGSEASLDDPNGADDFFLCMLCMRLTFRDCLLDARNVWFPS